VTAIPTLEEMLPVVKCIDPDAFIDEGNPCIRFKLGDERASIRASWVKIAVFIGTDMTAIGDSLPEVLAVARCRVTTDIDQLNARGRALNTAAGHVARNIATEAHKKEP